MKSYISFLLRFCVSFYLVANTLSCQQKPKMVDKSFDYKRKEAHIKKVAIRTKKGNRIKDYPISIPTIDSLCENIQVKISRVRNPEDVIKYYMDNNVEDKDTTYYYDIGLYLQIKQNGKNKIKYLITRKELNKKLQLKDIKRFHLCCPYIEKMTSDSIICGFNLCQTDTDYCFYFICVYRNNKLHIKEIEKQPTLMVFTTDYYSIFYR